MWNLRRHNADLTLLRPRLEEPLARHQFNLIILDPSYKVPGSGHENAKRGGLVRAVKLCATEGESPSGSAAKLPEFETKVKNGKV